MKYIKSFNYNLIPDSTIELFYTKIKFCIDNNESYEHYIRSIKTLNNDFIPFKIQTLIDKKP